MLESISNVIGFCFFCENKPFEFLDENNVNENTNFRTELGNTIRNRRKKRHMTQQQLANTAGVCRHTLVNIEWKCINDNKTQQIKTTPSYWKIANALGEPLENLFEEALSNIKHFGQ